MKQNQIEIFYDYYDGVANILYEHYKLSYLDGMNEAFHLLLDDTLKGSYDQEHIDQMRTLKNQITDVAFERENIRKSVQLGMLKGYKHTYSSNSLITPDTIGLFVSYLIKKFYQNKELETIFDPLVGSGNLLYTIANQIEDYLVLFGIDNDRLKCDLARNLGDLLDYEANIYFQDTLTFYHTDYDVLVTDLPISTERPYKPYQFLNHHIDSVKPGHYAFALIENDFFEQEGANTFKEEISRKAQIVGLVKLPDELFKTHPKSIFILRRHTPNSTPLDGFLLVDLPSFYDEDGMTNILHQIDQWIATRKDDL